MRYFFFTLFCITLSLSAFSKDRSHMRGERYCEILLGTSPTHYSVYNTIGLNDCPEALWERVQADAVKKDTGARFVHLNGPRYWVIDGLENSSLINKSIRKIGGIDFREAGILTLSWFDLLKNRPYQRHQVERTTTWVYDAQKPIYELIDNQDRVYIMQSYSVQKEAQAASSLAKLGEKLALPKGWSFKSGIIKKPAFVTAINHIAIVIQDDYLNTYQESKTDFLQSTA